MAGYLKKFCSDGELHFFGISGTDEEAFVAGRIFIPTPDSSRSIPELSIICLLESLSLNPCEIVAKSPPAAMVISVCALSAELLELVASAGIPYIILKDAPSHLYRQEGKVALLDARRNVLIVDPCLETLNRYPRISVERSEAGEPRLIKEKNKSRYLLEAPPGSELFEFLRDTSERLGAPPITLMLSVPRSRRDEDAFCEGVEALFRAAVYGDLSVMLKGHITDSELSYSFSLMHKVFCRLQQEEREFNGYLKKGFLISSPADIMRRAHTHRPDFLCFDIDSLLLHTFCAPCERLEYSEDVNAALRAIWRQYLDATAPDCPFWLKTRELGESELLRDFISFARIRDVYIDKR